MSYPDGDKASVKCVAYIHVLVIYFSYILYHCSVYFSDFDDLLLPDFDFALCKESCPDACEDLSEQAYYKGNLTSNTFVYNFTELAVGRY